VKKNKVGREVEGRSKRGSKHLFKEREGLLSKDHNLITSWWNMEGKRKKVQ